MLYVVCEDRYIGGIPPWLFAPAKAWANIPGFFSFLGLYAGGFFICSFARLPLGVARYWLMSTTVSDISSHIYSCAVASSSGSLSISPKMVTPIRLCVSFEPFS